MLAHFYLKRHALIKVCRYLHLTRVSSPRVFRKGNAPLLNPNKTFLRTKELEGMMELYKSKEVKKLVADVKRELLKMQQPSIVKTPN